MSLKLSFTIQFPMNGSFFKKWILKYCFILTEVASSVFSSSSIVTMIGQNELAYIKPDS